MRTLLQQYLRRLYDIGAVKIDIGGFEIQEHREGQTTARSPILLDLRTKNNPKPGPLTEEDVEQIGSFLWQRARHLRFAGVAGVPNAGNPLAQEFVRQARLDGRKVELLTLNKLGGLAEPTTLPRGKTVLLLYDTTTRGASGGRAVRELQKAGFVVRDCVAFLDRQQGAFGVLSGMEVRLHRVVTLHAMLDFLLLAEIIARWEYKMVKNYLKENS